MTMGPDCVSITRASISLQPPPNLTKMGSTSLQAPINSSFASRMAALAEKASAHPTT